MELETGISMRDLLIGAIGLLISIVTWLGSRLYNQVEKLRESKVDKTEYKEQLMDLKKEIRSSTDRQTQLFVQLIKGLKEKE